MTKLSDELRNKIEALSKVMDEYEKLEPTSDDYEALYSAALDVVVTMREQDSAETVSSADTDDQEPTGPLLPVWNEWCSMIKVLVPMRLTATMQGKPTGEVVDKCIDVANEHIKRLMEEVKERYGDAHKLENQRDSALYKISELEKQLAAAQLRTTRVLPTAEEYFSKVALEHNPLGGDPLLDDQEPTKTQSSREPWESWITYIPRLDTYHHHDSETEAMKFIVGEDGARAFKAAELPKIKKATERDLLFSRLQELQAERDRLILIVAEYQMRMHDGLLKRLAEHDATTETKNDKK